MAMKAPSIKLEVQPLLSSSGRRVLVRNTYPSDVRAFKTATVRHSRPLLEEESEEYQQWALVEMLKHHTQVVVEKIRQLLPDGVGEIALVTKENRKSEEGRVFLVTDIAVRPYELVDVRLERD
jgi:uncharacterized protein YoaH (UPF0181 family)